VGPGADDELDVEELVRAERERVALQVAELEEELGDLFESVSTNPPDDEHDAEGSTIGFERARVIALLDHALGRLSELDAALRSPNASGRRACEMCGQPIPPERIGALPETRHCAACSTRSGQQRARVPRPP